MCEIIVYSTPDEDTIKQVQNIIGPLKAKHSREIFHSIDELVERLRKPLGGNTIGLFMAGTRQDLLKLLSVQYLFRDIRLVLILPDREDPTVSKGFSLNPRYLTYADDDPTNVAAVMDKMVGSSEGYNI